MVTNVAMAREIVPIATKRLKNSLKERATPKMIMNGAVTRQYDILSENNFLLQL